MYDVDVSATDARYANDSSDASVECAGLRLIRSCVDGGMESWHWTRNGVRSYVSKSIRTASSAKDAFMACFHG